MSNDADLSAWPPNAMRFYGWGYLAGIERGRELAEAEMDRAWRPAYAAAQATARATPDHQHWAAVRARQVAACERLKQQAQPWPDEVSL